MCHGLIFVLDMSVSWIAFIEFKYEVLYPAEQQLRACLYTDFGLNTREFKQMWRAALRALATTSSPLRGVNTFLASLLDLAQLDPDGEHVIYNQRSMAYQAYNEPECMAGHAPEN